MVVPIKGGYIDKDLPVLLKITKHLYISMNIF